MKTEFHIASLTREDIAALGFKGADSISDDVMEKIAQKMCDIYVENEFWEDLDFYVSTMCGLEREEEDEN